MSNPFKGNKWEGWTIEKRDDNVWTAERSYYAYHFVEKVIFATVRIASYLQLLHIFYESSEEDIYIYIVEILTTRLMWQTLLHSGIGHLKRQKKK